MNFIKINNEDIKNNELNNNLPLFCFLMFNINDRNELCTSINQIAYEFKYKLNSKNTNGIQSSIKSELIKMSEKNIISLIPTYNCSSFDDITNNKLFKIKILNYDKNVNLKNNFTVLTYSEYKKILDCKDCGSKVYNMINLFLLIKSYEFTDESLCLDSINNMCHKLKFSKTTFSDLTNILISNKILYAYTLPDNAIKYNIKYAFSTKYHSKNEIKNIINSINLKNI